MENLKPCPFCLDGGRPVMKTTSALFDGKKYVTWSGYVECMECHTQGPIERDRLCERWNTRAERTCKNLATRKDDFACSECECEVVGCMVDDFGDFDNPLLFSYCPNCGAKVIGD